MQRNERSSPRMSRICPACEYDLTGLPEPCVCPECGKRIHSGFRSVRVWPASGRPNWILTTTVGIAFAGFSLAMFGAAAGALLGTIRQGGSILPMLVQICCGVSLAVAMGLASLSLALQQFHSLRRRMQGSTSAILHSSPIRVGLQSFDRDAWYQWSNVTRIDVRMHRHGWALRIRGRPWWFGLRRSLIRVVLPSSRRTTAHVRNTLRRHHRAWRSAQRQATNRQSP